MTQQLLFLPGNHLYPASCFESYKATPILMVEDEAICRRRAYHQQKLGLVLAAMREQADLLTREGFDVRYVPLDRAETISSAIATVAAELRAERLLTFEVTDRNLRAALDRTCEREGLTWQLIADPGFLTPRSAFADFANGKSQVRMAAFYTRQRRRLQVLLDEDAGPTGGRWSFDADNRKRLPRRQTVPDLPSVRHSKTTGAALGEVAARFSDHPGQAQDLWLPTTRAGALAWLERFIEDRLVGFGTYEDAISQRSPTLFHSALSPLLNLGLLTPAEVLQRVLSASERVPLNDLEGFVRQLIGWREFIRGVYDQYGAAMRSSNTRCQTRGLAACWHDATTGIPPLDQAISTQRRLGWNHHIERLMVIANLMNLCDIHPDAVYDYFMANYIDAYEWVMVPNVYGMGLNSDGGVFATKPYIAGSNYLRKMSDHAAGDWCDVVDGLYWRFVERHRDTLRGNARLGLMTRGLDRLAPARRQRIFSAAEQFLAFATT